MRFIGTGFDDGVVFIKKDVEALWCLKNCSSEVARIFRIVQFRQDVELHVVLGQILENLLQE